MTSHNSHKSQAYKVLDFIAGVSNISNDQKLAYSLVMWIRAICLNTLRQLESRAFTRR